MFSSLKLVNSTFAVLLLSSSILFLGSRKQRVAFPVRDFLQILERFSELLIAEDAHAILHLRFSCKSSVPMVDLASHTVTGN